MSTFIRRALFAAPVLAMLACGDSGSGPATSGSPARVIALQGATQIGVFGQPASVVPTVLVTDAENRPLSGVTVVFAAAAGTGSISSTSATTDSRGTATPGVWTLGSTFAPLVLTATVAGLPPVTFTAKAIAPDAGVLAFNITDPANDTLAPPSTTLPKAHDVLSLRGDFKRDSLILTLVLAAPSLGSVGGASAVSGFIELDTDESAATGARAVSNTYGATATTLGIDYVIILQGSVPSVASLGNISTNAAIPIPVSYIGNTVVVRIPIQALGNDDGRFALVGVIGTQDRPTDFFPNSGSTVVHLNGSLAALPSPIAPARLPANPFVSERLAGWPTLSH
ncbi:MAG: hypothetical protein H0W68_07975 [Gemmatimonadaceae bacterium]|nr:hypothetical protein [Gemmatimonadaceae bacterium]